MTKFGKRASLILGASALAIAAASMSSPVQAFDKVDWKWHATVWEFVWKKVDIDIDLDPSGLVMLENLQVHVGDINAYSVVDNINNNQPDAGDGGQVVIDLGSLDWTHDRVSLSPPASSPNNMTVNYLFDDTQGGIVSYDPISTGVSNTSFGIEFEAGGNQPLGTITVQVDPSGSFDALTELPEVVSVATAVANNSSVESNVAVQMHEGQFAWGDGAPLANPFAPQGNSHTTLLYEAFAGILFGTMDKGEVNAYSQVTNILNATVDSAATAVTNNKSITIDARTNDDALLIADVTQFGYMDVTAGSVVANVDLHSYTNLGVLDRPIVSSVATAVGNNLNINVSGPSAD